MHRGEVNCRGELMMIALVATGALLAAIFTARWVFKSDFGGAAQGTAAKGLETASALASSPALRTRET